MSRNTHVTGEVLGAKTVCTIILEGSPGGQKRSVQSVWRGILGGKDGLYNHFGGESWGQKRFVQSVWRGVLGGKNGLYIHFGVAKALFSYVNL